MAPRSSTAWDHFDDKGNYIAECKMCKAKLSYKSTVSNLNRHLKRSHPLVNLVGRRNEVLATAAASTIQNTSPGPAATTDCTPILEESGSIATEASGSRAPPIRRLNSAMRETMSSYIINRNASKCKTDIDNHIMNLFIMDFQPFRIVEDRGFKQLINFAFPFYTIPTRKYFSNNLLPSRYESLRNEKLQEVAEQVHSLCITCDIWTSRTNDAYLAITGHYIKLEMFKMKSLLLECVPLESPHTAERLSSEIKRVTDEWRVSEKVVLAVSDNGANIKKALLDLGWKHFGCYAHSLNLAVTSAIETSGEISGLITRVRNVVSYFKRSTQAWDKLKKYQEQAGKVPKRPLQDISTRWNSTFFMLKRIVEIKEEINSSLSNLGSNVYGLTTFDWEICQSLCEILRPCEEVTCEISAQNYVSASVVIPITRGLRTALEMLHSDIPIVEAFRQDLLSQISRRFRNIERSRTFSLCMFLDPRFKLYFEDIHSAEEAKRNAINLVSALMSQEDSNTPITAVAKPSAESDTTISSVWRHYAETMQSIQPRGTAQSRAIVEVQRYVEDKVVLFNKKTDVLQWWKDHEKSYPYLSRIAQTNLNILATSVPCERIFSAAGLLLNERRTRLGIRKLQQLMFVQQNS